MPYVVNLIDLRPPPRFDSLPWTQARIEEAAVRSGPWQALEVKTLSPVDSAPTTPLERSFTTTLAQLQAGWYRVVFIDAASAETTTDPIGIAQPGYFQPDLLPPAASEVRSRSALIAKLFPAGSADPSLDARLRQTVVDAVAGVQAITGRVLDGTMPTSLIDIALRAVSLMCERIAVTGEPTFAQQIATGRRLRGFSAGPYAEQYFAPGEFARRGAAQGRPPMDSDEQLDAALWALATDDARDDFIGWATGVFPAAAAVTQIDYNRTPGSYSGRGLGRPFTQF